MITLGIGLGGFGVGARKVLKRWSKLRRTEFFAVHDYTGAAGVLVSFFMSGLYPAQKSTPRQLSGGKRGLAKGGN